MDVEIALRMSGVRTLPYSINYAGKSSLPGRCQTISTNIVQAVPASRAAITLAIIIHNGFMHFNRGSPTEHR